MTTPQTHRPLRLTLIVLSSVIALSQLSACAPLVIGGAAATPALVATDRRTAGEQGYDKSINRKIGHEARTILGER